MSPQLIPYAYAVRVRTHEELQAVVAGLLAEAPRHGHNFEVHTDDLTIRVNELGAECAGRLLEEMT